HEDEFAGDAHIELVLGRDKLLRERCEISQRLLHGGVLERIQLDRTQRGVERDDDAPPFLANERVDRAFADRRGDRYRAARCWRVGGRRRTRHVPDPPERSARLTAFRTITSFSPAARCNDSCAFLPPILPSAMAAHARSS